MSTSHKTYPTFSTFWEAISNFIKTKNYPTFHPCCKVWVGRKQTLLRRSHTSMMTWSQIIPKKLSSATEPEELLRAHMIEHDWGTPIHLNAKCRLSVPLARRELPPQPAQLESEEPVFSGAFHVHQPATIHSSPGRPAAQQSDLPSQMRRPSDAEPLTLEALLDSQSQLYSAQ
jgi:hypothetical protein